MIALTHFTLIEEIEGLYDANSQDAASNIVRIASYYILAKPASKRQQLQRCTELRLRSMPTRGGWRFSGESNCGGQRHAFARAGRAIPRPHPDRPGARRPSPRAGIHRAQTERENAQRRLGTALPARWCRWISAPSVQVSCREESLSVLTITSFLKSR